MNEYVKLKWNGEAPTRVCTIEGSEKTDIRAGGSVEVEKTKAEKYCKFDKRFQIVEASKKKSFEEKIEKAVPTKINKG